LAYSRSEDHAILLERSYNGNPMQIQKAAGNVHVNHFPIWLALFDETLAQNLEPNIAHAWSTLAHRIGSDLSMGLEPVVRAGAAPPKFI